MLKVIKNLYTFIFTVTSVQDMAENYKMYSHLEVQVYKCKIVYVFLIFYKVLLNKTNNLAVAHLIILAQQLFNFQSLKYYKYIIQRN